MDIEKLRRLHAATTQGEWRAEGWSLLNANRDVIGTVYSQKEASFIASAHNQLPALLDEIEQLRAEVKSRQERGGI